MNVFQKHNDNLHSGSSKEPCYIAIDLKSFYASVECAERRLDPLDTNLVVADISRTDKTICLAVSPSLKTCGCGGRPRLFQLMELVALANNNRLKRSRLSRFSGKSVSYKELQENPALQIDFIAARPRMALYLEYSRKIVDIYRKYVSDEDIHVYSLDEVFIDASSYLDVYGLSAHDFAMTLILDVLKNTGVTATAGIGTNLYLSKIAMDILAKKMAPDSNGVRIASLDVMTYRELFWNHTPLSDFWRVGKGTMRRLEPYGIKTMGDIARCSLENENFLYDLFGINAELLIDHAWGFEPVTIAMIKNYRPEIHSMSSGQVLASAYTPDSAKIVLQEMAESLALDLFSNHLVTSQLVVDIGYEHHGGHYSHGSINMNRPNSSVSMFISHATMLFERIVDNTATIRRLNICATNVVSPDSFPNTANNVIQLDLFSDNDAIISKLKNEKKFMLKEKSLQKTIIELRRTFGKNSILKGLNYAAGATQRERNMQIGGHKA